LRVLRDEFRAIAGFIVLRIEPGGHRGSH
jgi:hypothetical protein